MASTHGKAKVSLVLPDNVSIRQMDAADAARVVALERPVSGWASDFPGVGDVIGARYARFAPAHRGEPWDAGWFIVENDLVVGTVGFKGEPVAGTLEVGYGVVPSARGRGVATTALALLLALVSDRDVFVTAQTAADNLASQGVLRRLNFHEIGRRVVDDGELLIWQRDAY